jgi:hypothetical protein
MEKKQEEIEEEAKELQRENYEPEFETKGCC